MLSEPSSKFFEIDSPMHFLIQEIKYGLDFQLVREDFETHFSLEIFEESIEELHTLHSGGFLTERDELARHAPKRNSPVACICMIMATDCNLRCKYCFAEGGSYRHPRKLMKKEVAEKTVDFLLKHSGWNQRLELDFFGGEPLLDFEVIKSTVEYAKKATIGNHKKFNFNVTTNGLILDDEKIDFFIAHNFGFIVSLDGPKEINDKCRVSKDGSGTHDLVVRRLKYLLQKHPQLRDNLTIRGTFTGQTYEISSSLNYLKNLGFKSISVEPAATKNRGYEITEKELPKMIEEYDKLAEEYLQSILKGEDYQFFHMHQLFFQVEEGSTRVTQCGAGISYLAVDPDGAIFPCHRLVGDPRYAMGNVTEGKLDPKLIDTFSHCSVPFKSECKKCWARYICGGGCHATAIMFNNEILKPHKIECELMKHRIKLGAWIYSEVAHAKATKNSSAML